MMLNGEDMFVRCRDHEAQLLRHKLVQLKAALNDTKAKANKIKVTSTYTLNTLSILSTLLVVVFCSWINCLNLIFILNVYTGRYIRLHRYDA